MITWVCWRTSRSRVRCKPSTADALNRLAVGAGAQAGRRRPARCAGPYGLCESLGLCVRRDIEIAPQHLDAIAVAAQRGGPIAGVGMKPYEQAVSVFVQRFRGYQGRCGFDRSREVARGGAVPRKPREGYGAQLAQAPALAVEPRLERLGPHAQPFEKVAPPEAQSRLEIGCGPGSQKLRELCRVDAEPPVDTERDRAFALRRKLCIRAERLAQDEEALAQALPRLHLAAFRPEQGCEGLPRYLVAVAERQHRQQALRLPRQRN